MPLKVVFDCLGIREVITVLNHVLLESSIVFVSEQISLLNQCVEAIRTLMYPFKWDHVIFAILPSSLTELLQAPVPFIAGIHASLKHTVLDDTSSSDVSYC